MAQEIDRRPTREGQGIGRLGLPAELATFQAVPADAVPDIDEIAAEVADATMPGRRELNLDGVDMAAYTSGMGTKSAAERLRADNEAKRRRLRARRATLKSVGQNADGLVSTRHHSKEARKIREARRAIAANKAASEGRYNGRILPEVGDPVSLRINTSGVPADWGDVNLDTDNYPGLMISGVAVSEYVGSAQAAADIEIALSEAQPDLAPELGLAAEKVSRAEERRGKFASGIVRRDQDPNRGNAGNLRSHDGRSYDQVYDGKPIGRPVVAPEVDPEDLPVTDSSEKILIKPQTDHMWIQYEAQGLGDSAKLSLKNPDLLEDGMTPIEYAATAAFAGEVTSAQSEGLINGQALPVNTDMYSDRDRRAVKRTREFAYRVKWVDDAVQVKIKEDVIDDIDGVAPMTSIRAVDEMLEFGLPSTDFFEVPGLEPSLSPRKDVVVDGRFKKGEWHKTVNTSPYHRKLRSVFVSEPARPIISEAAHIADSEEGTPEPEVPTFDEVYDMYQADSERRIANRNMKRLQRNQFGAEVAYAPAADPNLEGRVEPSYDTVPGFANGRSGILNLERVIED